MPKKERTLFIDGQVFQSAAWDRGMGKYSLELIRALVNLKELPYKYIYIIFTKNMPLDSEVKNTIKKIAPAIRQISVDLQVPIDPCKVDILKMQQANEATLARFITSHNSGTTDEVDYMILSLFIDQVCSVFPKKSRKMLLFYDLIPFQYHERYSQLCAYNNYLGRFRTLFQTDLILTISQSVADDVALNLGIAQTKLFNIDGAPIKRDHHEPTKPDIALPARYVLMPSGDEIRKNNVRAVQGFEEYIQRSKDRELKLIITSRFEEETKEELNSLSTNIIFAGNVKESELAWLYANAKLVLFVSEYEGLGLPVLEAVEANKPMVCSNLSVFNEISEKAFYFANQFDIASISDSLGDALSGKDYALKHKEYPSILERYTWSNTAQKAVKALQTERPAKNPRRKLRIAVFTPSPSGYSEIGRKVTQLHPAMQEYFDIDYYIESGLSHQNLPRPDYLSHIANIYDATEFTDEKYTRYDAVVYNIGNSEFHLETIKNALFLPGYAIFHDTQLANVFEEVLVPNHYISKDRAQAEHQLDVLMNNQKSGYITSIANRQRGIIVHSEYGKNVVEKLLMDTIPVHKLNLPTAVPKIRPHRLDPQEVCIGMAGIIHPAKGLDVIEAIAQSDKFLRCKIHIFGLSLVSNEVLEQLEAYPNVSIDTNLTDFEFQAMLHDVDVLINFRKEYRGEASAATIDAMRYGAVPLVKNVGWYKELPSECVIKASNVDEVLIQLEELILAPTKRHHMGTTARDKIREAFSYELYAANLYKALTKEQAVNNNETFAGLLRKNLDKKALLKNICQLTEF